MTFDEYNTDENFENDASSLEELVKIGKSEGKSKDAIRNSLSPKWQKSSKLNKFDEYYGEDAKTEPKEEKQADEFKEEEVKTTLSGREKTYNDKQNKLADTAKEEMLSDIKKDSEKNWQSLYDASIKRASAYKAIDDHYLEGLPNFIFRRYQNGEFGKIDDTSTPEGKESKKNAQLRLASFMINGIGTALSNASNIIKGRPLEESDAEKFRNSQMANALQNRWEKNKADTEGAIKAVEKEYGNEQDARIAAEQFTRDQKANTKWNMMNQNQKIFALQVTKEIGDMLGGMDTRELANFIAGSALTGDMSKDELMAVGIAKLAANAPDIIAKLPEGNVKDMVYSMIGSDGTDIVAGFGGTATTDTTSNNGGNGSASSVTLSDGTVIDPGKMLSFNDFSAISNAATNLSNKYYNGEMTEEQFRDDYNKLYNVVQQHNIMNKVTGTLVPTDKRVKQLKQDRFDYWNRQIDDLNTKVKNGQIKPSDYEDKFAELEKSLISAGGDANKTAKKKMSSSDILKAVDKINKTKSKKK